MEKIGSWKQSVSFRLFYRCPSRFILLGFIKFRTFFPVLRFHVLSRDPGHTKLRLIPHRVEQARNLPYNNTKRAFVKYIK